MKYIVGLSILGLVLSSCTTTPESVNTTETMTGETLETNQETMAEEITGSVVLDVNHPLAGKTLNFEVELVEITKAEGNTQADTAENGDTVSVHYVGTLEDGTIFDTSRERGETLTFTLGAGQMIPGFDTGVLNMKKAEVKNLVLPPEEAYGEYDEELRETIPKKDLQEFVKAGFSLEVGEKIPTKYGELEIVEVIE